MLMADDTRVGGQPHDTPSAGLPPQLRRAVLAVGAVSRLTIAMARCLPARVGEAWYPVVSIWFPHRMHRGSNQAGFRWVKDIPGG